jgi:hypothetical protein
MFRRAWPRKMIAVGSVLGSATDRPQKGDGYQSGERNWPPVVSAEPGGFICSSSEGGRWCEMFPGFEEQRSTRPRDGHTRGESSIKGILKAGGHG